MMPASDRLYRAIVEQRVSSFPTTPSYDSMCAAIARHSRRGWRIDKANRADNIDAVVAMCMALEAVEQKPAEVALLGWV